MRPAPGARIDRFEIRELLGVGGMGEVYRAHDSRLNRDVALKFLPEAFLENPERRARFERETLVLAALNHPNIAVLHEALATAGSHCLVMELVEGETLSVCLARGAMTIAEALGIAAQVAAALEAAHDQGVVHRDLKPSNVKLRPDGTVKLLDFGLAKILDAQSGSDGVSVTVTALGELQTAAARIMGSPTSMSPEQARGLPVDKRTDVWAFGCLLYQMLCGSSAFEGESASDVMARILEREPDFNKLPPGLPTTIHRLLRRCLEKDRRRRLRDIGDARLELLDALDNPVAEPTASASHTARSSVARGRKLRWLSFAAAVVALIGVGTWLALRPGTSTPSPRVMRFSIPEVSSAAGGVAISADGGHVAYTSNRGLVVRALDGLDSRVAAAANIAQGEPFFSTDGAWLGFKGWDALLKVPVAGGAPMTVVDRVFPASAWVGDDIYFGDTRGLFRVPAAGGRPEQLLATSDVEQIVSVEVLPGREAVLYTVIPTRGNVPRMAANMAAARIEALDLRTRESHVVLRGGGRPQVVRTGHLLYVSGGTLYAADFDAQRLQRRGEPIAVLTVAGLLDFDISDEGTLFYRVAQLQDQRQMVWVDRQGREQALGAPARPYIYPRISPDGARIALDVNSGDERDIWVWDEARATLELLTKDPAHNPLVAWSPDGRYLAYGSERTGVSNVYLQAADGSGQPERLIPSDSLQMPMSFTDGGQLLVSVGVPKQQRDIHLMTVSGKRSMRPLIYGPANELWAEVSPDGRWIAYDSDESGQFEVYVRPFPNVYGGSRWQISADGGRQPLWSRDGREIFYRDFPGAVVSVSVAKSVSFHPGRPRRLFASADYNGSGAAGSGRTFDVSADGRRFLMLKAVGRPQTPELVVVVNWFEELRRLAPLR